MEKFQEAREQMESRDELVAGTKITVELLKPSCHLTGACWKSFRKHVISFDDWVPKRRVVTEEEKKQHKETRKGKVYFIDVVYNVPKEKQAMKRTVDAAQGTSKAGSSGMAFGSGGDADTSSEDEAPTGEWLFAVLSGRPSTSIKAGSIKTISSEDDAEAPGAKMAKLDA